MGVAELGGVRVQSLTTLQDQLRFSGEKLRLVSGLTAATFFREIFCQRNGGQHGLGFIDRFLKFTLRRRVIDPAASGLHIGSAIFDQRGSDGDAAIEISVE